MPYSLVTLWPSTVEMSPVGSCAGMMTVPFSSVLTGTYTTCAGSDFRRYVPSGSPGTTCTGTVIPVAGSMATSL